MSDKIQYTEDYSSFKRIKGNRTINKAQVQKLYASFNENPDIASAVPIIVNDKMEIVDGQHRFEAWKRLGHPIPYIQIDGLKLKDVQTVNSATKTWRPVDYARSFAELGNDNYKIYLDFNKEYSLCHSVLVLFLSKVDHRGGGSTSHQFRNGAFKADNMAQAKRLAERLLDIKKYFTPATTHVFAVAFKKLNASKDYNHSRMIEKIKLHGKKRLKEATHSEEYMRQLEQIYNYRVGEASRVKLF